MAKITLFEGLLFEQIGKKGIPVAINLGSLTLIFVAIFSKPFFMSKIAIISYLLPSAFRKKTTMIIRWPSRILLFKNPAQKLFYQ